MSADQLRIRRRLLTFAVIAVVIVTSYRLLVPAERDDADLARRALLDGDFVAACEFADAAARQHPEDLTIIAVGAEAAQKSGQQVVAIEFLNRLPPRFESPSTLIGWQKKAELQKQRHRISDARNTLETILQHVPDDDVSRHRLVRLLSAHGYYFDAVQHAHMLLSRRQAKTDELVLLAQNGRGAMRQGQLERSHAAQPHDPMPLLGLIRLAADRRDPVDTRSLLSKSTDVVSDPSCQITAERLRLQLASSSTAAFGITFRQAMEELHAGCADQPETWLITAEWARQSGDPKLHSRCLAEALIRDPWNVAAIHALAASVKIDMLDLSVQLTHLAQTVTDVETLAGRISRNPDDIDAFAQISSKLVSIGRQAEATAWACAGLTVNPKAEWAIRILASTDIVSEWRHPAQATQIDLEIPVVHRWLNVADSADGVPEGNSVKLLFETTAFDFRYDNDEARGQRGRRMHQWTGGGVGVIDIDNDSWPDLYFTQGGRLSPESSESDLADEVIRNVRGTGLTSVTTAAAVHETRFGQGVAVGDVNNDGFDDLYIANIGKNRLLLNQGDGTFTATDLHRRAGVWTTSVAIADIDADGNPDLYDANYLSGADVFTKTCDHDGYQRVCGPTEFAAEADQLFFSDGKGSYLQADPGKLPVGEAGRGMGVIVCDFDGDGRNDIFIANDESANQLFVVDGDSTRLTDVGPQSGLAYDHYGQAQGSMGIALGDPDHNGRPDIFVTNYYGESNTLYSQLQPSIYSDVTPSSRLAAEGYSMLGFGCQFLDIECDGDPDLIVANGHLDDFTHVGQLYQMRPQLFCNEGAGQFREAQPQHEFFSTPTLARSLALLDWNRDGRCDFAVTHLASHPVLVTNLTAPAAPAITLQLVSVGGSRIPVGASVAFGNPDQKQYAWITAGDGYQCSNEKLLRFVDETDASASATVYWPSGSPQTIRSLPSGRSVVIEGRATAYPIPR